MTYDTHRVVTESFNQPSLEGGFATQLPQGHWQGQTVNPANGSPRLVGQLQPQRTQSYMSEDKRWEKISSAFVTTLSGTSTAISLLVTAGLHLANMWPLTEQGLNLVVTTVPSVVLGFDISTLLSFTLYGGIGLSSLGVAAVGCLGAKYLYVKLFGDKQECGRQLQYAKHEHTHWQEQVEHYGGIGEELQDDINEYIPYFQNCTPQAGFSELDRRHQVHLHGVNRYNSRDPKKAAAMRNAAIPLEREFRKNTGIGLYDPSPEDLEYRLSLVKPQGDGTIGSRLLQSKRSALMGPFTEAVEACREGLKSVYSRSLARDPADQRQDTFEYEDRKRAATHYINIKRKRAQLERNERESRARVQHLSRDYSHL